MNTYFKKIIIIMGLGLMVVPFFASAAEMKYFEFAPADTSQSINIASVEIPYQPFRPYNDFISGFDIWVDNPGSAGIASFGLHDSNDNVLATQTITIPSIPEKWSGTPVHVKFDNPVKVSSASLYKIKMVSSMPKLEIYYADKVQLLQHNANYVPTENILDSAQLGTTDQNFYFKIALYEDGDNVPPTILNATATLVSADQVKIQFNADEPVDFNISLVSSNDGTTQTRDFTGDYYFCNPGISTCDTQFGVTGNTLYSYTIDTADAWGNHTQVTGSFQTQNSEIIDQNSTSSPPNQNNGNPPQISMARIVQIDSHSVKIAWSTDKPANSKLYVTLDAYGNQIVAMDQDQTYELEHLLNSGNALSPASSYFAMISSMDSSGNQTNLSLNFTTPEEASPPQNQINPTSTDNNNNNPTSSPNNPNQNQNQNNSGTSTGSNQSGGSSSGSRSNNLPEPGINISQQGNQQIVSISWHAPSSTEPNKGYRVDILSDDNSTLVKQIFLSPGTHEININDLKPGKYFVVIYANNNGIFEKIAKVIEINVPEQAVSLFQKPIFYWSLSGIAFLGALVAYYAVRIKKYQ